MQLREATLEDAKEVARIQIATWKSTYSGIVADSYLDSLSVEKSAERWSAGIRKAEPGKFLILTDDGVPRGFVSGGPLREPIPGYSGEIYALYVELDWQKNGLGKALLKAGIEHLIALGMPNVVVCVLSENPALCFYQKMGGAILGEKVTTIGGKEYPETVLGWFHKK
jgi:ribosomal protein S18 acetylase RimI-like enzyme